MLVAIVVSRGFTASRTTILWFISIFATFGLAYFLWRWCYFGHPLPNPFYKKGGGTLHAASLKDSIFNTVKFTLPLVPLYAIGIFHRDTRRNTIAAIIPLIGFAACFVLISNEMNFAGRFQYAILPLALMAWPIPMQSMLERAASLHATKRASAIAFAAYALFAVLVLRAWSGDWSHHPDGRAAMGKLLHEYQNNELRLATSEAGLLPLYSEWKALDAWGLNDSTIARAGTLTHDYLATFDPDVIVVHAYDRTVVDKSVGLPGWDAMIHVMQSYVNEQGFMLAAVYGIAPGDAHFYYVHPRLATATDIVQRISNVEYRWPSSGAVFTNFAIEATSQLIHQNAQRP
jgi:hypothetical protein